MVCNGLAIEFFQSFVKLDQYVGQNSFVLLNVGDNVHQRADLLFRLPRLLCQCVDKIFVEHNVGQPIAGAKLVCKIVNSFFGNVLMFGPL